MFKTVDGELKVFNKTILSTQNNLKNLQTQTANLSYYTSGGNHVNLQNVPIAQPQTVSNFTKLNNAFNVYNSNLTKSTGLQNAYIKSVGAQNQALGNYLAGLKGAPASFGGYIAALTKAKLATIGLHAASIALNMALTMGVAVAISALFKGIDYLIHRTEKMQEALENSVSEFNSVTDELKSLEEELKTTTERLGELQKLADNGTISVAEEAELETLKKTNKELARKIALKQQEQAQEARDVLKDSKKNANSTVTSKYKGHSNSSGERFDYENLTPDEELYEAIKAYETNSKAAVASEGTNLEGWYEDQTEAAKNRIEEMYDLISPTIDAYEDLINAGIELEGEDKTRYEQLKKTQDAYLSYIYTLNGTKEAFEGLNAEQQRNVLLNRLIKQGLSEDVAKAIIGSISDEDLSKYWDKNFSFVPPEMKDDETAEEYGKRYAEAWVKGLEDGVKTHDKMTVSLSELEGASDKIKTLGSAFKELSDDGYITTKTLGEIQTATGLSGDEWAEYETKLLNAKKGSAEFNQVLSELTYKILENEFATIDLTNATDEEITAIENKIAAILRENGVTNASAVAHEYMRMARVNEAIAAYDGTQASYDSAAALISESLSAEQTKVAMARLELAKLNVNKAKITSADDIDNIIAIANAALVGAEALVEFQKAKVWAENVSAETLSQVADGTFVGPLPFGKAGVDLLQGKYTFEIDKLDPSDFKVGAPRYSGGTNPKDSDSGSNKNDALDNFLKAAEQRYEIHEDEIAYIDELNYALKELCKTDEERYELNKKIEEAYSKHSKDRIADIEHYNELLENQGLQYSDGYISNAREAQKIIADEDSRYRKKKRKELLGLWGLDEETLAGLPEEAKTNVEKTLTDMIDSSDYIQELQKDWWSWEEKIQDALSGSFDEEEAKIEHKIKLTLEADPYADITSFYDQLQEAYHAEAERLRAINPIKYADEIRELSEKWWDAEQSKADWRKEEFNKATDLASSYLDSRKTLLQSYFDVTNSIAEAQHEINKELEASMTMYAYLDEETRQLLFNQEDYNKLSKELTEIQDEALRLKADYEQKLNNATLDTIEEITSNYEMQYETLMKSYEIAKAELEVAKKRQQLDNVLNERNVRMFVNGQWQWVANTQDVINAQNEYADAKYEAERARVEKTQTDSLNNLTAQQDKLGTVINQFESGVIDLDTAVGKVAEMFGSLPSYMYSAFAKIQNSSTVHSSGGSSSSSYSGNLPVGQIYRGDSPSDYGASTSNLPTGQIYNGEWLKYKSVNAHATGTRFTPGGLTALGEIEDEMFITNNGHLIPINQPTLANIGAGGIVFNHDQMEFTRSLWDMANMSIPNYSNIINHTPQPTTHTEDNRIIINGMTVDSGSSDGRALISAFRRYVGNH